MEFNGVHPETPLHVNACLSVGVADTGCQPPRLEPPINHQSPPNDDGDDDDYETCCDTSIPPLTHFHPSILDVLRAKHSNKFKNNINNKPLLPPSDVINSR